jgi:hypothetical protein
MGRPLSFDPDLPDQIGRCQMWHQQGGDQDWADHRFRAVQGEISGDTNKRHQSGNETLERELKEFYRGNARGSYAECNQFGLDGDPTIAEESEAESQVHAPAVCIHLEKRARR